MIAILVSGSWLIRRRMVAVATLSLIATIAMVAWLFATAHGTLDYLGRPLGTDFSNVWSAGFMADHGRAAAAWNWHEQAAMQQAIHGDPSVPFYGWHYPPPFLLVAALVATIPYVPALILWQLVTLVMAVLVVQHIVPGRLALLATIGAPVVLVCLGHGHNGFLTAALFGGGLLLLDRRPLLSGILLGCLAYKPQFALLVPLVLIGGRNWRAVVGGVLSSSALVAATLFIWGWPVWQAFIDSLPLTRTIVIEAGATGWEKIQTPFSAIRSWGGGTDLAYAVQGLFTGAALLFAGLGSAFARSATRNAVVLAAALLSTPYALDYDFTILGIAIAFLIADGRERGFLDWEKTLLACCWIAPLFAREIAALTLLPLGLASACAVFALAVRRAARLDLADARRALACFRASPSRH